MFPWLHSLVGVAPSRRSNVMGWHLPSDPGSQLELLTLALAPFILKSMGTFMSSSLACSLKRGALGGHPIKRPGSHPVSPRKHAGGL